MYVNPIIGIYKELASLSPLSIRFEYLGNVACNRGVSLELLQGLSTLLPDDLGMLLRTRDDVTRERQRDRVESVGISEAVLKVSGLIYSR
jgi:hypothetical protein